MAKKKPKCKKVEAIKKEDIKELELQDDDTITYYLNFDEFQTHVMFSVMSPKSLTPKEWIACMDSFVDDVRNGDIDIQALFDDGFCGVHH